MNPDTSARDAVHAPCDFHNAAHSVSISSLLNSYVGGYFISSPPDKTPEVTRTTIKSDISKHLPRLPKWAAGWARTFLIGIAVALQNAGEYLFSIALFLAACFSFISAVYHWNGIEDSPRLTRFSRMSGIALAIIFALAYIPWIVIRKDGRPWSNLTAAVPETSAGKTVLVPRPPSPSIPLGWDTKTERHAIAVEHVRRAVPAKPSLHRTEQFLTNVMLFNDEKKIYCAGTMGAPIRQTSCGEMANVFNGTLQNKDIRSSLCVILQHYLVTIVSSLDKNLGHMANPQILFIKAFCSRCNRPTRRTTRLMFLCEFLIRTPICSLTGFDLTGIHRVCDYQKVRQ